MKIELRIRKRMAPLAIAAILTLLTMVSAQQRQSGKIPYPDLSDLQGSTERGGDAISKLKPELRMLYEQFTVVSRGGRQPKFSAAQLQEMFSIKPGEENPFVGVAISVSPAASLADIKNTG